MASEEEMDVEESGRPTASIHWIDRRFFDGGDYVSLEVIGEGYTANVHRAVDLRRKTEVGIKLIRKGELSTTQYKRLRSEIEVWQACCANCENIVQLYEVFDSPEELAFVMELADMDLWDAVKYRTIPKEKVAVLFAQTVEAVYVMHTLGFVHRDLKLENLLYKEEIVKVCDFGFSCTWSDDHMLDDSLGTLYYSSPEIVNGSPYRGPEVDVWALGVILYALLLGEYPFFEDSKEETRQVIRRGEYCQGRRFRKLPPVVKELIDHTLQVDPNARISIEQLHDHPFVARGRRDCSLFQSKLHSISAPSASKVDDVPKRKNITHGVGVHTLDLSTLKKPTMEELAPPSALEEVLNLPASSGEKKKDSKKMLKIPRLLLARVFQNNNNSGPPTYG